MKVAGFFEDAPSKDALDFLMYMNWAWWYQIGSAAWRGRVL